MDFSGNTLLLNTRTGKGLGAYVPDTPQTLLRHV